MNTYHPPIPLPLELPIAGLLGVPLHSSQDIPHALRVGLPFSSLSNLAKQLELSQTEALHLTDISEASLRRRRKVGLFSSEESERIFRYAEVVQAAFDLFGDEESARGWLKRPRAYFQEQSPLEVARSEYGARKLLEYIAQLEVGSYL